jgi:hypothetical protein
VDAAASGAQVIAGRVSRERSDGAPTNDFATLYQRHCERSEAIHSFFRRRDGLLRCARNDGLAV